MSEDDKTTKPTIETVLDKINALGQQMIEMREIVVRLEEKQDKLQVDLAAGLKRVERKIAVLNDNMLTIQGDQRDLETRVEKLEPKAS